MRERGARCVYTRHRLRASIPAPGSSSCGGERDCSGSGRRAAGAWSVRVAGAGRAQRETEGNEPRVFLECKRRGESRSARGSIERGGDMRTYWLHSVWVLGFFLSLFSLQGKEGCPGPARPLLPAAGLWGVVGGVGSARKMDGTRLIYKSCGALPALPALRPGWVLRRAGVRGQTCCNIGVGGEIWNRCVCCWWWWWWGVVEVCVCVCVYQSVCL